MILSSFRWHRAYSISRISVLSRPPFCLCRSEKPPFRAIRRRDRKQWFPANPMAYCSKWATVAPVKTETRVFPAPVAHRETTELTQGADTPKATMPVRTTNTAKDTAKQKTRPLCAPNPLLGPAHTKSLARLCCSLPITVPTDPPRHDRDQNAYDQRSCAGNCQDSAERSGRFPIF